MPNVFKNEEQRGKWNNYNKRYSAANYKTISVKLHKKKDKDIIDYLENSNKPIGQVVKEALREKCMK